MVLKNANPTKRPQAKKTARPKKSAVGMGAYDFDLYEPLIDAINDEVAMVTVNGRVSYIRVPEFMRGELAFYPQSDIRAWLGRYRWLYGSATDPKSKPGFDLWLQSDKANRFEGVDFRPDEGRIIIHEDGREILNRFAGLSPGLEPNETGSYALFLEHLTQNICGGDLELVEFCLDWTAQLLQQPEKKSKAAIMIRGAKGTGKSLFSNVIATLVGKRYCTVVDSADSFLGRFNGHLADALLIQFEEGYFAGDPSHVGRLNNLITGDRLQVERKGMDSYTANHYARVIMTSNEDHVVPATGGERRFVVLDCLPHRKQDSAFFGALINELEAGGYGRLLHDLGNRDISKRDWGRPPMTAGLSNQIRHTMKSNEEWWADLLTTGVVGFTRTPDAVLTDSLEWSWDQPLVIERDTLFQSFCQLVPGFRRPPSPAMLGRFLRDVCPEIGERRIGGRENQAWCHVLPPRKDAMSVFLKARPGLVLSNEAAGSKTDMGVEIEDRVQPTHALHSRLAA